MWKDGEEGRRGRRQTGEKLDKAPVGSDRSQAGQGEDDRMIVWHCAPCPPVSCPLPGNMFSAAGARIQPGRYPSIVNNHVLCFFVANC